MLFYYLSVVLCITGVISLGKCVWIQVTNITITIIVVSDIISNININMISTIISIHSVQSSPEGHVQMLIIIVMKIKLTTNYSPWHYHQHE